ncbi:MAG: thioredoxin [Actinobacteria bacterium]|nr:thioredoxin [Actinomycetota bacterium]NBR67722.1 thioredoxin [Actinomycetota bacterium]
MPADITSHALTSLLTGSPVPVLVDFWAPWCGPCKAMLPALTALEGEVGDRMRVIKVNVDAHPDVLGDYRVQSIPTLLLWKGGAEVARRVGAASLSALREFVAKAD